MMKKNSRGFTLLEVLVTLLILTIGLLGLAGLQSTGIRNNLSAYHRSQATQLFYDIADRMRSNAPLASSYVVDTAATGTEKAECLTTSGCSSAEMALNDIFIWKNNIAEELPSGVGQIVQAGPLYTVTISWDDNRSGAADTNFVTSFQP